VTLSPTSGPAGTSVSVGASGFPGRARGTVTFDGTVVASFRTSREGTASAGFAVPNVPAQAATVTVVVSRMSSSASFLVTAPVVTEPVVTEPVVTEPVSSSAPPPAGGYRSLTPVGTWSSLPSDAQAAAMVRRSSWEPRPQNAKANATVPSGLSLGQHGGVAPVWNDWLLPRVTGNFTGTTDEIVQWAAAKWGLPDEVLRAQMISESSWYQGLLDANGKPVANKGFGDYTTDQSKCPPGYTAACPLSFGVLQIKYATYHPGTFPHSRDSTAFNIDYLAAIMRGCYEGWESWLASYGGPNGTASNYAAGDLYGCLGRWYSGGWHTPDAESYISSVKQNLTDKAWLRSGF
jgi:autotransporter family porin